ncbi:hypothetical protein TRFO_23661 [Tritrichomonas foetus]|uniref:Uncharacterized protein n=1 Tax=Tritrichomonas foetus TaxID=1144522 RepID=A0A1J4KE86_9EUKA|nr:hypothetical protein TRFO_23661 [Tritrichomonas foetus]|eukprot:OHT08028.1 hypothetical protein TRFO_23661 [Tritrichomonas foetus]
MLRLYLRAYEAHLNVSKIEEVAQDTVSYCLKRSKDLYSTSKRSFPYSLLVTSLESQGILSNLVNNKDALSTPMVLTYAVALPIWITMEPDPHNKVRIMAASVLQAFPWSNRFRNLLKGIGLNSPLLYNPAISLLCSSYQVITIKLTHGVNIYNIFDTGYKVLATAVVHLISRKLTTVIHDKLLFFIPEWIISSYIAFETAPFLQRMVRYGIVDACQWLTEFIIHMFTFLQYPVLNLPSENNYPIHESLMCPICRDILEDPVEITGSFFCSNCLTGWLACGESTHPSTGELVSREMFTYSYLMNTLAWNYKKAIIKKCEENNKK